MKNKNVFAVTNLLRCLDVESLRNPEVVANLVRAFGIMSWGTPVLNGPEAKYVTPIDTAAIGQTPTQISEALVYLSRFKINSFCEIGMYYGGNFLFMAEYLRRFNPEIRCVGVDPTDYLVPEIKEIIDLSDWLRRVSLTSEQLVGKQFDLVFIDGDHSAEWVKKDYENLGAQARFCMFHDLQEPFWPAVGAFWKTLKGLPGKTMVEFLACHPDRKTHGIGLIHNRKEEGDK